MTLLAFRHKALVCPASTSTIALRSFNTHRSATKASWRALSPLFPPISLIPSLSSPSVFPSFFRPSVASLNPLPVLSSTPTYFDLAWLSCSLYMENRHTHTHTRESVVKALVCQPARRRFESRSGR